MDDGIVDCKEVIAIKIIYFKHRCATGILLILIIILCCVAWGNILLIIRSSVICVDIAWESSN